MYPGTVPVHLGLEMMHLMDCRSDRWFRQRKYCQAYVNNRYKTDNAHNKCEQIRHNVNTKNRYKETMKKAVIVVNRLTKNTDFVNYSELLVILLFEHAIANLMIDERNIS